MSNEYTQHASTLAKLATETLVDAHRSVSSELTLASAAGRPLDGCTLEIAAETMQRCARLLVVCELVQHSEARIDRLTYDRAFTDVYRLFVDEAICGEVFRSFCDALVSIAI